MVDRLHGAFFRRGSGSLPPAIVLSRLGIEGGVEHSVNHLVLDCHLKIAEHLISFGSVDH